MYLHCNKSCKYNNVLLEDTVGETSTTLFYKKANNEKLSPENGGFKCISTSTAGLSRFFGGVWVEHVLLHLLVTQLLSLTLTYFFLAAFLFLFFANRSLVELADQSGYFCHLHHRSRREWEHLDPRLVVAISCVACFEWNLRFPTCSIMSSAAAETNEAGGGGEQSEPMPTFSSPEEEMAYWKKELSRINDVHSSVSARDENDDDRNNDKLHVPLREVDRADNEFLNTVPEAAKTNQYWYSAHTISVLAAEACDQAGCEGRIACVSTPSIFFSLPREFQDRAVVLDFDRTFAERTANFVPYDFNHPTDIATELQHTFDVVVIDPPFITEEVRTWMVELVRRPQRGGSLPVCCVWSTRG